MIQRELTPQDVVAMLRRRWVLITILAIVGGALSYGVSRFLPNEYTSQTMVLVEQPSVPADFVKPVDTSDINQRLSSMEEQILSRTRLTPLISQFGLYPQDINRVPTDDLVARLRKAITVAPLAVMPQTQTRNLPGFNVTVKMDNPHTAQQICAEVTSMFIEENLRNRQRHSEDTTSFLAQQLGEAKTKLDEQDAKLAAFQARYMGSLPDEEKGNLNVLMGLTTQLDAVAQALARAHQDKSYTESMLAEQSAAWKASQSGSNPATLEQQLSALQSQLASLQAKYTDDYPDVIHAKDEIAALKERMAKGGDQEAEGASDNDQKDQKALVEPPQIAGLRAQIYTLNQAIAEKTKQEEQLQEQIRIYQQRVQSSPAIEQQFKQLTRDYQTAEAMYNDLLRKRDQSAMATDLERRQQGEQFRVFDPANLPDKPSFPNRPLFALGGFGAGLSLGLGLAFLLEVRDTSLKSERDVELILHLPVLAVVAAIEPTSGKKPKKAIDRQSTDGVEVAARS
jgi:polysaccharide chain length determinant protein (PEP-CTERM system associated)